MSDTNMGRIAEKLCRATVLIMVAVNPHEPHTVDMYDKTPAGARQLAVQYILACIARGYVLVQDERNMEVFYPITSIQAMAIYQEDTA